MNQRSGFFDAIKKGDLTTVKEWLAKDRSLVNARSENGFSPLTIAAYYGKHDILKEILDRRPTLDLHEAAILGNLQRVKEFVEQDASQANNASSPDGFPPLGLAAHFGHMEVVRYLLDKGAEVNFAAKETGFTALTGAIAGGHREIVRELIAAGADVNHRYEEQEFSPLLTAAADGDQEVVQLLIDAGADVRVRTKDGKTPISLAVERGHPEVAELLRARGAE